MQLGGLGFDQKHVTYYLVKDTEERNFYPFGLECLKRSNCNGITRFQTS